MSARSSALSGLTISRAALPGEFDAARSMGFRRCYRRPNVHHGVGNLECDCLRVDIPVEARAKNSGRLATDFEGMARKGREAAADRLFSAAWGDRSIRDRLSKDRASGRIGRREP